MKPSLLNRKVHRWGSIAALLPVAVIIVSGIILQLKKQSDWHARCSRNKLKEQISSIADAT